MGITSEAENSVSFIALSEFFEDMINKLPINKTAVEKTQRKRKRETDNLLKWFTVFKVITGIALFSLGRQSTWGKENPDFKPPLSCGIPVHGKGFRSQPRGKIWSRSP